MSEDLRLKLPFTCIISGPSVSGKSSFCIKLLQNFESLDTESKFDGGILWCYVEKNAVPSVESEELYSFRKACQTILRTLDVNRV